MQLTQNILIRCWSRFHLPHKACPAAGPRVLLAALLQTDCWLYAYTISYLSSLKQTQLSLKGQVIYVH